MRNYSFWLDDKHVELIDELSEEFEKVNHNVLEEAPSRSEILRRILDRGNRQVLRIILDIWDGGPE